MNATHVCFADMPLAAANQESHSPSGILNDDAIRECRSVSPNCSNSPIPRYERNMGFFHQLSRRFGLRSNDDLIFTSSNEDDNQSSSTDSYSSHTPATAAITTIPSTGDNNKKTNDYTSCASSETSSTVDFTEQLQRLQLQQQEQQQHQQQNIDSVDNNVFVNNADETDVDSNENSDNAIKSVYNKERKSLARSSFSRLHRRSTSSIRRAFEAFSLSSRSFSCSGATPPPTLPTSSFSSTTNNGTPIKSALKSSSNLELNKKSESSSAARKLSTCSVLAAGKSTCCSSSVENSSKSKTKPPPQRILRQPVSYTYLKGISGLPTQRVPRNSVCCQYARR